MTANRHNVAGETLLIVFVALAVGLAWNWSLLRSAWRGEVVSQVGQTQVGQAQAPAAPVKAEAAEQLPMPIALMQVKESYDAKEAVLVDARSRASYAEAHIAGAVSLPLEEMLKDPRAHEKLKLPKDATIIAYCNGFSCHDSMDLGKLLIKAGYPNVYIYEGGLPEWRDAGHPVAKGAS